MTYAKGSVIQATDYNILAGLTSTAAASSAIATAKAGYLWGVGYGDRGYGQTTPVLTAATDILTTLINLQTTISNIATWQNTNQSNLPPSILVASGAVSQAYPASSSPYSFVDLLSTVDNNRLNYQVANMALTSAATTTTRSTNWGAGGIAPADQISSEISFTFASEDAARYFFNTGGELRLALAHPNTSTPQDTAWNTILNNFNCAFKANATVRLTGSYGVAQAVGYYQLTTSYQTIINGNGVFTSPYISNNFLVEARSTSIPGVNGAKGTVIYIRTTLTDGHTNAFYDVVKLGTNGIASYLKANAVLSNLPASPTCAVVTSF